MKTYLLHQASDFLMVLLAVSCVFLAPVSAQTDKIKGDQWTRIESISKDFSIALPAGDYLVRNENENSRIWYSANHRFIFLRLEKLEHAKSWLTFDSVYDHPDEYQRLEVDDFAGRWFTKKSQKNGSEEYSFELASSHGMYEISVRVPKGDGAFAKQFLGTARLGGKPLINSETSAVNEIQTVSIKTFKTSDVVKQALDEPDSDLKFNKTSEVISFSEIDPGVYSRDVVILSEPNPEPKEFAKCRVGGTVVLKVALLANGTIGSIQVIESVEDNLDHAMFEAVKRIKFLPAEIDGKPVDVTMRIERPLIVNSMRIKGPGARIVP